MKSLSSIRRTCLLTAGVIGIFGSMAQPAMATITADTVLPTDGMFGLSFWYTQIPMDAALHPNSVNYVKEFLRQKATYYNNVTINTWSYASPVYVVGTNVPTVTVKQWDCQRKGWLDPKLAEQWSAVPMPAYAIPSAGSDAEMTVYQPATDTIWEFWRTARDATGQWQACWGGRMQSASKLGGLWGPSYGVTAAGLPFSGGQITAEELARGEIRHAIGISLVDVDKASIFSWPAMRSDGYNPTGIANRIPEGTRFRLDPAVNVDALYMTRAGKIIAKAAQKYGFVVWDKAGSISLRAQNPYSYTALGQVNPYPVVFDNKPAYAVLNGFPWERLQFLPFNYGKP